MFSLVAAKWGKAQVCALLIDRQGSIEAKTRDGLTPLHCAARYKSNITDFNWSMCIYYNCEEE